MSSFYPRRRRAAPGIIIIALIDVLIVMLTFLLVSTTYRNQPAVKLALPEVTDAPKEGGTAGKPPLVVTIAATEPAAWIQEGLPSLASVASDVADVRALLLETDAGYVDPRENGDVIPLRAAPAAPVATSARSEHALVLSARGSTQGLWMVGGRDTLARWSHEVRRFDIETRTWTTLPTDRRVPARRQLQIPINDNYTSPS